MYEANREENMVSLKALHDFIELKQKDKVIELGKTYWASEWSWNPLLDGIYDYEETIRSTMNVDGIDVYFTNKNYRFYLKEDLYESQKECVEICKWKNEFVYDYDCYVDRKRIVSEKIKSELFGDIIVWRRKDVSDDQIK